MSYTSSLPKIQPAPLTLKTLPKYVQFITKHGETPAQYIERMDEQQKSLLIEADVKNFLNKEKTLGSRRKSQILKTDKLDPEQDMKEVTYFNTDLQKYVTTKIPSNINIVSKKKEHLPISLDFNPPELDYSDLYNIKPISGGSIIKRIVKKRISKRTSKKRVSKKRASKKRSGGAKKPIVKKRVSKKRVSKKRVSKKRVSKKPIVKKRVSKKPIVKKRVSKKRVSKKPIVKKRVSKKRVSKKRISKRISKKRVSKKL